MEMIDKTMQQHKSELKQVLLDLKSLAERIGHNGIVKHANEVYDRSDEPYLFVIVGEVKAGKSSFINALMSTGEEICKVAPDPCTDQIQQIVYGNEPREVEVNPYYKKIYRNEPILKDIGIVDTPGTNTIIEHHQEVTERFIPIADLIIFVFEAKNPYRQSAWTFFDYIHSDWRKNIIFVLQQKDLLSDDDLAINVAGVKKHVIEKGMVPQIFAVSAKMELEGNHGESGFSNVREYVNEHITKGDTSRMKQDSIIASGRSILDKIREGVNYRNEQYQRDQDFRDELEGTLDQQSSSAQRQVDLLVENLILSYNSTVTSHEQELSKGLSFGRLLKRSFAALFNKESNPKKWLDDLIESLENQLNQNLQLKLGEGILDVGDSIQNMAKMVELKLQANTAVAPPEEGLFEDIISHRNNLLDNLKKSFSSFIRQGDDFVSDELVEQSKSISPRIATSSGIAIVGVLLSAVTNGVIFDVTGGVLTTLGVLFAGVTAGIKKKQILKSYRKEVNKGRDKLNRELEDKLSTYVNHIRGKVDQKFEPLDVYLKKEKTEITLLYEKIDQILSRLNGFGSGKSN